MDRIKKFKDLIDNLDKNCPAGKEDFKYIGTGNPNANILIIGKETAVNDIEQQRREMTDNFLFWKERVKINDLNPQKAPNFFSSNEYIPLYPYKGQVFKLDNGENRGTSRTWFNYQKLYNNIYNKEGNQNIDFHENIFITEVNSTPSKKTKDADTSSIEFRKENILKSDFIEDFPVIIISGVGYFEISNTKNEVVEIFDIDFTEKKLAENKESQPYWIHWNKDKSKILINTYQLSMGIADKLLEEVAELIKQSGLS